MDPNDTLTVEELDDLPPPATELEAKERARARRKAEQRKERDAQRLLDLEAIEELETALGDSNVSIIEIGYSPGLPTLVACRTPSDPELKRFRHQIAMGASKNEDGRATDPLAGVKATEMLADVTRVYPNDATYAEVRKAKPGVHLKLGNAAVALSLGRKEQEGKA